MPGFDRTGPVGQGAQTGLKLGKCKPNNQESNEQLEVKEYPKGLGKRFGHGKGSGLGRGSARGAGGRGMGRRNGRNDT